jgi:hypothetical protein
MVNQASNLGSNAMTSVSPYERFIRNHFAKVMIICFYHAALALGLCSHHMLIQSPLIRFVGKCAGFLASAIAWIPAFLFGGLVFGKFYFSREVFRLYLHVDFNIAMGVIFLSIPVGILLGRILVRFVSSFLFWSAVVTLVICFSLIVEYMNGLANRYAYFMACFVIGILYVLLMRER